MARMRNLPVVQILYWQARRVLARSYAQWSEWRVCRIVEHPFDRRARNHQNVGNGARPARMSSWLPIILSRPAAPRTVIRIITCGKSRA
jgi:hypothetical protein